MLMPENPSHTVKFQSQFPPDLTSSIVCSLYPYPEEATSFAPGQDLTTNPDSSWGPVFADTKPSPFESPASPSKELVQVVPLVLPSYLSIRSLTALCALALPAPYGLTL